MITPPRPHWEEQRLSDLYSLNILDTPPDPRFETLTALVKQVFEVEIVAVSLVDADRQWFKARQGLDVCETSRDVSFCGHAILKKEIMLVADARLDERFADNPLVTGAPFIRFYAGAPLVSTTSGLPYGTLCIISSQPRVLSLSEQTLLRTFADLIETEIEHEAERQLQSMLQQSQKAQHETLRLLVRREKLASLGRIAAGIAHELNNPLGFVVSNLNQLREYEEELSAFFTRLDQELPQDMQERVLRLQSSLDIDGIRADMDGVLADCLHGLARMTDIIRALRDYTSGNDSELTACDVNQLLLEAVEMTRNQHQSCSVRTELGELPRITCCGPQIMQALCNMIINAAQAIADRQDDEPGCIILRSRHESGRVVIEVADNGTGIAEENRDRVFDAFFTTRDVGEGTGLGLHVCHDIIVNRHHGDILLHSAEGAGAVFIIRLPAP